DSSRTFKRSYQLKKKARKAEYADRGNGYESEELEVTDDYDTEEEDGTDAETDADESDEQVAFGRNGNILKVKKKLSHLQKVFNCFVPYGYQVCFSREFFLMYSN